MTGKGKDIGICALGELLIDFTDIGVSQNGSKIFERNPGGAPANLLATAQALGVPTAFIGKVGNDMHGLYLKGLLESLGIDCSGLVVDPDVFTTLAFVELGEDGERQFSFARKPGADTQLSPEEVNLSIIERSNVFHIGSLSLTDEPARSATMHALEVARRAGCIISYDPNYRASLWDSEQHASDRMKSVLPMVDAIKVAEDEAFLLTGRTDPEGASDSLLEAGASLAVVTLAERGAFVRCRDGSCNVSRRKVDAADTTGAGDSFWGGFLAAMLKSGRQLEGVGIDDAMGFAEVGCAVASLCVQKLGGIPSIPSMVEVESVLGNN
ncbi:MAG: carbohydrate kinase family protein [Coriobacteriales bacterium]|jgi:fructokinase